MGDGEMEQTKEYLSVQEACELGGFKRSTFYTLLAKKETGLAAIVYQVPGMRRKRIRAEQFKAWLEGRK